MIVSASYRTDIPAYYGEWFRRRLAAGFARVRNPYGGRETRVSLAPADVDGFVFWTRNIGPFAAALDAVAARATPFMVQFTVTGYPRALEAGTIAAEAAIDQMRTLADRFGPRAVVWRYDPVATTDLTPPDWHRANAARLARALRGATDEMIVSFVEPYRKTQRNLDAAASRHGFSWRNPPADEKRALVADLASIADDQGMALTLCTQPTLLPSPRGAEGPGVRASSEVRASRCIDSARLSDIAGRPVAARTKGNRPGCLCAESRDIGAYDSCGQGCAYCYAVADPARARAALRAHDPAAESLAPSLVTEAPHADR